MQIATGIKHFLITVTVPIDLLNLCVFAYCELFSCVTDMENVTDVINFIKFDIQHKKLQNGGKSPDRRTTNGVVDHTDERRRKNIYVEHTHNTK